jgi:hypothetical protein
MASVMDSCRKTRETWRSKRLQLCGRDASQYCILYRYRYVCVDVEPLYRFTNFKLLQYFIKMNIKYCILPLFVLEISICVTLDGVWIRIYIY